MEEAKAVAGNDFDLSMMNGDDCRRRSPREKKGLLEVERWSNILLQRTMDHHHLVGFFLRHGGTIPDHFSQWPAPGSSCSPPPA